MSLGGWFHKQSQAWQNKATTVILVIVMTALWQVFQGAYKDYTIKHKEERIQTLEVSKDSLQLKLQIERNKNVKLQIELVRCQTKYNFVQSSLNDIPIPCWIRDVETNFIVYVNQSFVTQILEPMGKSKYELIGKPDK